MATSIGRRTVRITPREPEVFEEHEANSEITPGMVLEGGSGAVDPHSTTDGKMVPMVATEVYQEMKGNDIDTKYASGDKVSCWTPRVGDIALLILADGENVSDGDYLASYGDTEPGALHKNNTGADSLFQAQEDLDLSASSTGATGESSTVLGENYRIKVKRVA